MVRTLKALIKKNEKKRKEQISKKKEKFVLVFFLHKFSDLNSNYVFNCYSRNTIMITFVCRVTANNITIIKEHVSSVQKMNEDHEFLNGMCNNNNNNCYHSIKKRWQTQMFS